MWISNWRKGCDRSSWQIGLGLKLSAVRSFLACRGRCYITLHSINRAVNHTLKHWSLINSTQRNGLQHTMYPKIKWSCNTICFIVISFQKSKRVTCSYWTPATVLQTHCIWSWAPLRHHVCGGPGETDCVSVFLFVLFHLLTLACCDFPCGCAWLKVG